MFTQRGKATFIESGTGTAQTLTTVILTAVIILVSISDDDLLVELIEDRNYESILFSFEYTVALSITTSVIGSIIQSYSFGNFAYAIFSFLLFYTVFASLSIVSKIITLGHKKAQQTAVGEIDDDIGDDVEIIGPDGKKRESIDGEPIEEGEK
ncbi:hypothetical protein [Halopenitus sp. POP-27]|uniref:hypothetical protein n=1 Tax=Halopenitus sp. POP-27 TaxID=2994425 RepID=UPI002469A499|nr:hypothetical protein [Halopenitus sp. POP-27]